MMQREARERLCCCLGHCPGALLLNMLQESVKQTTDLMDN